MAHLRIWWHRAILGHYVGEVPYNAFTDYYDYNCKRHWKLSREDR